MALLLGGSIADNAGINVADIVARYMAWFCASFVLLPTVTLSAGTAPTLSTQDQFGTQCARRLRQGQTPWMLPVSWTENSAA